MVAMDARDPARAFVRVPNEPGRWVYTDRCVVEVPCPHCEAAIGEPCHNGTGKYWAGTHYRRRERWRWSNANFKYRRSLHEEAPKPHIYRPIEQR